MTNASAYPLSWPPHVPRAKHRQHGAFKTSLEGALRNVESSIRLFGKDSGKPVSGLVISSNYTLGVKSPNDPGVAVYFTWDDLQVCFPVDRYRTLAANLQAIHHIIEARRVELRHGSLHLVRASFQGFAALPAPGGGQRERSWWEVLDVSTSATVALIEQAYRAKARACHPDHGGSNEAMAELNAARERALREVQA